MAETKLITSIYVVTDSETSYDNIGDIDGGGIDKEWLKKHIASHGADGLFKTTAWINFQVFEALREVNMEKDGQTACVASKPSSPIPEK